MYKLNPVDSTNERGRRTWNWDFGDKGQVVVFHRKAGENFGAHFHKGLNPSKDPECLLLVSGKMRADFKGPRQAEWTTVDIDAVAGPMEIVIPKKVLHAFFAYTDVLYIEYQTIKFAQNRDTFKGLCPKFRTVRR